MKITPFAKVVNLVVAFVFLMTSTTYGVPRGLWETRDGKLGLAAQQKTLLSFYLDPAKLVIPENFGSITERFTSAGTKNSKKLIIQIQDSHCNYEAQTNICKIVEAMCADKETSQALKLIAAEGAQGLVDPVFERSFPDPKIREQASDYFMKIGWLTGTEMYAVNFKDQPLPLWGIEDKALYDENLDAFRKTKIGMQKEKEFVEKLSKAVDLLKLKVFSKDMVALVKMRDDWDQNVLQFTEYCAYINKLALGQIPLVNYPNFIMVIDSMAIEKKIDPKKIDGERQAMINDLQKKMVKEELSELVKQSLFLRTGKITSDMFYAYLKESAATKKLDMSAYPNLAGYMEIVFKNSKVNAGDLFEEVDRIEKAVKSKMYVNAAERKLDETIDQVKVLKNLLDLRMTRRDLAYYENHKKESTPAELVQKISVIARSSSDEAISIKTDNLDFSPCTNFYDFALKRDKVLVENTISEMENRNATAVAFVTGGFHTQGAKEIFKAKGYSYVVVTPRMTQTYDDKIYLSRMLNEQSEFDKLFANSGTRLAAWTMIGTPKFTRAYTVQVLLRDMKKKAAWVKKLMKANPELAKYVEDIDIEEGPGEGVYTMRLALDERGGYTTRQFTVKNMTPVFIEGSMKIFPAGSLQRAAATVQAPGTASPWNQRLNELKRMEEAGEQPLSYAYHGTSLYALVGAIEAEKRGAGGYRLVARRYAEELGIPILSGEGPSKGGVVSNNEVSVSHLYRIARGYSERYAGGYDKNMFNIEYLRKREKELRDQVNAYRVSRGLERITGLITPRQISNDWPQRELIASETLLDIQRKIVALEKIPPVSLALMKKLLQVPMVIGVTRTPFDRGRVRPASAAELESTVAKYIDLEEIDHVYVPDGEVDDTRKILKMIGAAHVEVMPFSVIDPLYFSSKTKSDEARKLAHSFNNKVFAKPPVRVLSSDIDPGENVSDDIDEPKEPFNELKLSLLLLEGQMVLDEFFSRPENRQTGIDTLLRSADPRLREAAIFKLASLQDPLAIDPLIDLLKGADYDTSRNILVKMLKGYGAAAIEPIIAALKDEKRLRDNNRRVEEFARYWALIVLAGSNDPRAIELLIDHVKKFGSMHLTDELAAFGVSAVPFLKGILRDENEQVRKMAVSVLGEIADPAAAADLIGLLDDPSASVRLAAIQSLGKLGSRDAVQPLIARLDANRDRKERAAIVAALVEMGDQRATDAIFRALKDKSVEVRCAAVTGIGRMQSEAAFDALAALVRTEDDDDVRKLLPAALAGTGDARAVEHLLVMVNDPHWEVRECAIPQLGILRDKRAVGALQAILADKTYKYRQQGINAAAEALGEIGGPEAIAALKKVSAMHDVVPEVLAKLESQKAVQPVQEAAAVSGNKWRFTFSGSAIIQAGNNFIKLKLDEAGDDVLLVLCDAAGNELSAVSHAAITGRSYTVGKGSDNSLILAEADDSLDDHRFVVQVQQAYLGGPHVVEITSVSPGADMRVMVDNKPVPYMAAGKKIGFEEVLVALGMGLGELPVVAKKAVETARLELKPSEVVSPAPAELATEEREIAELFDKGKPDAAFIRYREKAVTFALKCLRDGKYPKQLRMVLGQLVTYGDKSVFASHAADFAKLLGEDQNAAVRSLAVRLLGKIESEDAVAPLMRALDDADPAVRKAAQDALYEKGVKFAVMAKNVNNIFVEGAYADLAVKYEAQEQALFEKMRKDGETAKVEMRRALERQIPEGSTSVPSELIMDTAGVSITIQRGNPETDADAGLLRSERDARGNVVITVPDAIYAALAIDVRTLRPLAIELVADLALRGFEETALLMKKDALRAFLLSQGVEATDRSVEGLTHAIVSRAEGSSSIVNAYLLGRMTFEELIRIPNGRLGDAMFNRWLDILCFRVAKVAETDPSAAIGMFQKILKRMKEAGVAGEAEADRVIDGLRSVLRSGAGPVKLASVTDAIVETLSYKNLALLSREKTVDLAPLSKELEKLRDAKTAGEVPRDAAKAVRLSAVRTLAEDKKRTNIDVLAQVLAEDPDADVRAEAAAALGAFGDRLAVGPLLRACDAADEDPRVREKAEEALKKCAPAIIRLVYEARKSGDEALSTYARNLLPVLDAPRAVQVILVRGVLNENPRVRSFAVHALAVLSNGSVETLLSLLREQTYVGIRSAGAEALVGALKSICEKGAWQSDRNEYERKTAIEKALYGLNWQPEGLTAEQLAGYYITNININEKPEIEKLRDSSELIDHLKSLGIAAVGPVMLHLFRYLPYKYLGVEKGEELRKSDEMQLTAVLKKIMADPATKKEAVSLILDFLLSGETSFDDLDTMERFATSILDRAAEIRTGDISAEDLFLIYSDKTFVENTKNLGRANQFSVARAIELALRRFNVPVNGASVKIVLDAVMKNRGAFAPRAVLDKDTNFIVACHEEERFKISDYEEIAKEFGALLQNENKGKGAQAKTKIKDAIEKSAGKTTVWLDGHGGPNHFWLSSGAVGSEISDDLHDPRNISYLEFADWLTKHAENNNGRLSDFTIIDSGCFSANFIVRLLNELKQRGIKEMPVIVTATNRGVVAWGSVLYDSIKKASAGKIALTMQEIFDAEEYAFSDEDFAVFLPVDYEALAALKKTLSELSQDRTEKRVKLRPVPGVFKTAYENERIQLAAATAASARATDQSAALEVAFTYGMPPGSEAGAAAVAAARQYTDLDSEIAMLDAFKVPGADKAGKRGERAETVDRAQVERIAKDAYARVGAVTIQKVAGKLKVIVKVDGKDIEVIEGETSDTDFANGKFAEARIIVSPKLWAMIHSSADPPRVFRILARHEFVENFLGKSHAFASAVDAFLEGTTIHALMLCTLPLMKPPALLRIGPIHPNDPKCAFFLAAQAALREQVKRGEITAAEVEKALDDFGRALDPKSEAAKAVAVARLALRLEGLRLDQESVPDIARNIILGVMNTSDLDTIETTILEAGVDFPAEGGKDATGILNTLNGTLSAEQLRGLLDKMGKLVHFETGKTVDLGDRYTYTMKNNVDHLGLRLSEALKTGNGVVIDISAWEGLSAEELEVHVKMIEMAVAQGAKVILAVDEEIADKNKEKIGGAIEKIEQLKARANFRLVTAKRDGIGPAVKNMMSDLKIKKISLIAAANANVLESYQDILGAVVNMVLDFNGTFTGDISAVLKRAGFADLAKQFEGKNYPFLKQEKPSLNDKMTAFVSIGFQA